MSARDIRFIDTDDAVTALTTRVGRKPSRLRRKIPDRTPAPCRIDHFGLLQTLAQEAHATVDLAQALLAVDVIAIFGTITVEAAQVMVFTTQGAPLSTAPQALPSVCGIRRG